MTLHTFEQQLNKVQLAKGLGYFESGCISELEEWETGAWNAIVAGSEDYHVKITLKKGAIEKSSCDCPHDAEYCKHIIAVLYAIKEERVVLPDKTNIKSTSIKGTAKKPKDAIGEMVNKIPVKDLRRFVVDHAETDRGFRNMLVAHFSSSFSESGS